MVERALGGAGLGEDVLDARRVPALGLHEAQGDVDELVASKRVHLGIAGPGHRASIHKPTVGL